MRSSIIAVEAADGSHCITTACGEKFKFKVEEGCAVTLIACDTSERFVSGRSFLGEGAGFEYHEEYNTSARSHEEDCMCDACVAERNMQ